MSRATRYPVGSLAALMRCTPNAALTELGVSGSTAQGYKRYGVSAEVAERLAERAGFHPYEVWPELRDDVIDDIEKTCAHPKCSNRFVPHNVRSTCCSRICMQRLANLRYQQRRYDNDPAYRERQIEASRRYYETAGEYVRARVRRSYYAQRAAG